LGATLFELAEAMVESDQFRRSDKSEIFWVEEEDNMLAAVIGKLDLLHRAIGHHGLRGEVWGWLVDEYGHVCAWG